MGDLIVALGAVAVILGGLLLGFGGRPRGYARNFCLTFGWLMVLLGLGAESAALVSEHAATPAASTSAAP